MGTCERLSAEFVGYQITFNVGTLCSHTGHVLESLLTKTGPQADDFEDLMVSEETSHMHRSVRPVKDPLCGPCPKGHQELVQETSYPRGPNGFLLPADRST